MFRSLLERGRSPIGIDFGTRCVRMLQLSRGHGGWTATAAAAAALPDGLPADGPQRRQAEGKAIRQMLGRGGFTGRRVVTCLPSAAMQFKSLRLPAMPGPEMQAAVEWEAADRLKLGDAFRVQFLDAGEVRQGEEVRQEIILLAAGAEAVDKHVELLAGCDLDPVAIDACPAALARWAAAGDKPDTENTRLVMDVGHSTTKVLVCRQGQVIFFKSIDTGTRDWDAAVAKQLNLSAAEACELRAGHAGAVEVQDDPGASRREQMHNAVADALKPAMSGLARELALCLRYYSVTFRGHRPEQVMLVGGGSGEGLLRKALHDEAAITWAEAGGGGIDWTRVPPAALAGQPVTAFAAAAGLAMRPPAQAARKGAA